MAQQIKKKFLDDEVISYFDDQINTVESSVAQEIADRISADASTLLMANTYTDMGVAAEAALRVSGDAASVTSSNAYSDSGDASTLLMANTYTDMGVAAEAALRVSGDAASVTSSNAYSDSGDASTLLMANNYTNSQIVLAQGDIAAAEAAITQEILDRVAADLVLQNQVNFLTSNIDPTSLDSLTEIVSAFQAADSSLNGAITSLSTGLSADIAAEAAFRIAADSALQGEVDAEEVARAAGDVTLQNNIDSEAATRLSADNALDARLDIVEAVVWFKEQFSISNGQTSVTLSFSPKSNSVSAYVDRLAIHQTEDYSISGSTVTFLGDLVSPGQSQIGSGDTVYFKYQK